jgi:D-inositol-3-phosphate glycosyltransferase
MSPKRYNIALLSVHSSPLGKPGAGDTGGMSIYIRELVKELAALGHTIDIFTRAQEPDAPEIIDLAPGVRLVHIKMDEQAGIDKLLVYTSAPDFACGVEDFRKKMGLKYDLIFSHYWISGITGRYLQAGWNVPEMTMFHTLGAIKNALGIGEDEPDLRLEEERQVAADSRRILASTETEKIALFRFYDVPPEKVSVLPCGVNLDLFRPLDKIAMRQKLGLGEGPLILFVGRIERLKGLERIVAALPYLASFKPKLVIVGEDGNRSGEVQNLKLLAVKHDVADSMVFKGLVPYEQLPEYYNAADVCVFPSYYESFGLVPLEALACGTPVVATNVGDLRNIIRDGETGYVLFDHRPRNMADRIAEVLRKTGPHMQDPQYIRASVAGYSWRKIAQDMSLEFDRLVESRLALSAKVD